MNKYVSLICLTLLTVFSASALHGQPADADLAPEAEQISLGDMFKQGGWAMYPLLLFSIAGLGLTIYCALLIRETNFTQDNAVAALKGALAENDFEKALAVCDENPGTLTQIIKSGLGVIQEGHQELPVVNEAMEETATRVLAGPMVFVQYLQVIASISPMMGLLGTVSGMVKAFRNIAAQGMGRPELLANNISEALVTTATGLLIAIPALMAYFYFKNKYARISSGIYETAGRVTRSMMSSGWVIKG
jgi:biopolymer transport protein ExbB